MDRLKKRLPGLKAQLELAPTNDNKLLREMEPKGEYHSSAVMMLIYPGEKGDANLLLTLRSSNLNNHKGQISFPGGRSEPGESPEQTALREAREETGINTENIEVLGTMSDLYVSPSKSMITPVVCFADETGELKTNPDEVEKIMSVGLNFLLDKKNMKYEKWQINGKKYDVPLWDIGEKAPLWGATAMIISELLALLKQN